MAHIHTLLDGTRTGPEIRDTNDPNLHWHEVLGSRTSSDPFGPGHMHDFRGDKTSTPIEIDDNDPMNSDNLDDDEDMEENEELSSDDPHDDEEENDKIVNIGNMESKHLGGQVLEVKEEARNGVPVGIVKGYIATWDLDRGLDRFIKGAFADSLIELRTRNRQIRFKDHHGRTIGGFPIDRVFEDDKGLFGVGEINLEVQQGREAFSLAKQGVLSDFSIGFSSIEFEMDGDIRNIHKAIVWEGSIVDEPMNPEAQITEVKAVVPFQDLPLADRNRSWNSTAAIARIREFTDSDEEPSAAYRKAFVWFDSAESTLFGSYKLPIADVINGRLTAVPRAIFAAAAALQGARGGVDVPETDRPRVIRHIERYYAKMDLESPFKDKQYYVSSDVKEWTARDLEKYLKESGGMSKSAAKIIASRLDKEQKVDYNENEETVTESKDDWEAVLRQIKSISL